jgi:hypothetical protein
MCCALHCLHVRGKRGTAFGELKFSARGDLVGHGHQSLLELLHQPGRSLLCSGQELLAALLDCGGAQQSHGHISFEAALS